MLTVGGAGWLWGIDSRGRLVMGHSDSRGKLEIGSVDIRGQIRHLYLKLLSFCWSFVLPAIFNPLRMKRTYVM